MTLVAGSLKFASNACMLMLIVAAINSVLTVVFNHSIGHFYNQSLQC